MLVAWVAWLSLAPWVALGQPLPTVSPDQVGLDGGALAEIDTAMQAYVDQGKLAGIVILVAREGQVAHAGVYGQMDLATERAMRRDAIFRIYSMTKPITGVALMSLYDEGRFQLDDPVSKYLAGFESLRVLTEKKGDQVKLADLERPVTIRDLMCHTAGLAYGLFPLTPVDTMYTQAKLLDRTQTLDSLMERLLKLPLAAQPGQRWMYSIAVDVQGKLIEVLSGKPLDQFFTERVFQPLAMHDTAFFVSGDKLDRLSVNYSKKDGRLFAIDGSTTSQYATNPALLSGGGGLVSTADDYLRFAQMLLNRGELDGHRILKPETVDLMTQNHLPDALVPIVLGPLPMANMGFGLDVAVRVKTNEGESAGSLGEFGWGGAASTQFFVSPRENLVCIAMAQFMPSTTVYFQEVRKHLYQAVLEPAAVD